MLQQQIKRIKKDAIFKSFQVMMPERLYEYKFHNDIEVMIKFGVEKDGLYKQAENDLRITINLLEKNLT